MSCKVSAVKYARLMAENATLRAQVAQLSAPVSDYAVLEKSARNALAASERLRKNDYVPRANAGGDKECAHGITVGIDCRECDEALVHTALCTVLPAPAGSEARR
jgi:hypothetical protein